MRAVRRIPHHGRSAANPRTRRAANMQYQSPGSTLMVLSPGDRDREAMDPIAELLSQLSSVRSRTAAAQSVSSQLQQLEMQLHSSSRSSATGRLQADRLTAVQPISISNVSDPLARSVTTIAFPSSSSATSEQQTATVAAAGTTSVACKDRSAFLLARLDEVKKSESEQQNVETERADKSLFVQELLLALLAEGNGQPMTDYKELLTPPTSAVSVSQQQQPKARCEMRTATSTTSPRPGVTAATAATMQKRQQVQPPNVVSSDSTLAVDHHLATAAVSQVSPRSNVHASSNTPLSDSRITSSHSAASTGPRAIAKRKSVPATNTTKANKEVSTAASSGAAKRH